MVAVLADHLWQSTAFSTLACLLARLARPNSAAIRLWLWRAVAIKFLVPFTVLFAIGGWLGFHTPHTADPAPQVLLDASARWMPWFAPAQTCNPDGGVLISCLALAIGVTGAMAVWLRARIHREEIFARLEAERVAQDPDYRLPGLGFFKGMLFGAVSCCVVAMPMLSGALDDHQHRRALLIENSIALRDASVVMQKAAPGMGSRSRVIATSQGVLIRNTNIRDLIAIAYGVNLYSVWSDQMYSSTDVQDNWLSTPRYDARVSAPIREPEEFDPYALRRPITHLLAERFGLEIYVNDRCQPPCGRYGVPLAADAL